MHLLASGSFGVMLASHFRASGDHTLPRYEHISQYPGSGAIESFIARFFGKGGWGGGGGGGWWNYSMSTS